MIVYLDMDGVLANIHEKIGVDHAHDKTPREILEVGFYRGLNIVPGAKEAVAKLLGSKEIDPYIASKITTKNLGSATEKYHWVKEHFPELLNNMFLACDKTLLRGDFLVDDDLRWKDFTGKMIHFDHTNPIESWKSALEVIFKKEE